eukprot:m.160613 g.160613  ORF g.160613 m.160613 type:complete len:146 (-) comp16363_c5_seq4:195-632(-)
MSSELSDRQLEEAKNIFHHFDKDRDGRLSVDEAKRALAALGLLVQNIHRFDVRKTGSLELGPFLRAVGQGYQTTTMNVNHLKLAFVDWDTDKNGVISPAQIKHLMKQGGYPPGITEADVDELIEFADTNGDGQLSLVELAELLTK